MRKALLTVLVFLTPGVALAHYGDPHPSYQEVRNACSTAAGGVFYNSIYADCISQREREFGDDLTEAYQQAIKQTSEYQGRKQVEALRQSERVWLQYQSAVCAFEEAKSSDNNQDLRRGLKAECSLRTTLERFELLYSYLSG